jgi:glycerophosphoryl diester phosphodiesterase
MNASVDLAAVLPPGRSFAHRGWHDRAGRPENSLSAVQAAVDAGGGVEVDIRLSGDGVPVVFHDATLTRMCGIDRPVAAVPVAELARMRLAGSRPDSPETIPTLAAVLDLVAGRAPVLLDVKPVAPGARFRLVAAVADALRSHRGPCAVVGFDPWLLRLVARLAPWAARGQSAGVVRPAPRWGGVVVPFAAPLDRFWLAPLARPHFLTYNVDRLPSSALPRLRRAGWTVLGWTVRSVAQAAAVAGQVDALIVEAAAAAQAFGGSRLLREPVGGRTAHQPPRTPAG